MQLTPGSELSYFRIVSPIGAGGMGEVYLAQDTRLGREVALKILPDSLAHDPDRRSRFEREARVLASLNHPNIATLLGLQQVEGRTILEMEFVPGETLAERLQRGSLSVAEALPVFKQIAQALEAAHERGIVHRDLKPANIKVIGDGRVKVLDFGLAKALDPMSSHPGGATDLLNVTSSQSQAGMIVGTARYMSPEQARGQTLDRRSDIWSFGCVLYEAVAGRPPFTAETMSDTLAAILREEPDWTAFAAPAGLQRLAQRCLRKDLQSRLRDIADARIEIEDLLLESQPMRPVTGRIEAAAARRTSRAAMAIAAVAVLAALVMGAVGGALWTSRGTVGPAPARVAVSLPPDRRLAVGPSPGLTLSPDGRRLVYVGVDAGSRTQLFSRPLDKFEAIKLSGTEGATAPFFSPDGNWIGFYGGVALQKVSLDGGAPLKICDTPPLSGATWLSDGSIIFGTTLAGDGLWRVSADGGTPERLTQPDASRREVHHLYPASLQGSDSVIFIAATDQGPAAALLSIASRTWRALPAVRPSAGGVHFVSSGHLVFAQDGALVAVPFDPSAGETRGSAIPGVERVAVSLDGTSAFAVSDNGTLAYVPGSTTPPSRTIVLVDFEGRPVPLFETRSAYAQPRFSPDGRWLAMTIEGERGPDVWLHDLQRGTRTPLTSGGAAGSPVWSRDGGQVAFYAARSGAWTLYARAADGSRPPDPLLTGSRPDPAQSWSQDPAEKLLPGFAPTLSGANPQFPASWTADGNTVVFVERKPNGERDIWTVERGLDPMPFLLTPSDEWSPALSPDGRWLAYVSDDSGRNEVYVQPYPGPGGRWIISTAGGAEPIWAPSGGDLYYRQGDLLMAVSIQATSGLTAGTPRRLFEGRFERSNLGRNYDLSPDGKRFVLVTSDQPEPTALVHVVLNWREEFQSRR